MKPRRAAWLLCVALLAACGSDAPSLSKLATDGVILAFGDSLTRGTGAKAGEDYPSVLAGLIDRRVVNAGVPGEVSKSGLARLPRLLDEIEPALLILCHGGNDMLQRRSVTSAADNLRAMITLSRDRGVPVLLLGVPEPGLFLSTADFYETVAEDTGTPLEADAIPRILGQAELKADPVHPNAAGYRLLAERVAARLRTLGAL